MLSSPRLGEVGVIALPYHRWSMIWTTPHHILTRLSHYFHVVWVNPAHEWQEALRMRNPSSPNSINTAIPSGFRVYTPELWLPKFYRPRWLAERTLQQRLMNARNLLHKQGCKKIVLYLWHPQFSQATSLIPYDISCYHIDDEYSFSKVDVPSDKVEVDLLARVNQVFITSKALMEKKGSINPNTAHAPQCVDYNAYAASAPVPVDLAQIPHPRIGYTGILKKQLDWKLLLALAQMHQDWSFVLVGPQSVHSEIIDLVNQLKTRNNVHFLGAKSVQDLSKYPQHFDVSIMPYQVDAYTQYIYPLKLHEYLASGTPVVGTPIRTLRKFAGVVKLARTTEEWSEALTDSLQPTHCSIGQIGARREIARKHDWQHLIKFIARTLCERVGGHFLERFEEIEQSRECLRGTE